MEVKADDMKPPMRAELLKMLGEAVMFARFEGDEE